MDSGYTLLQIVERYDHVLIDNNVLSSVPGMRYLHRDLQQIETASDLAPHLDRLEDYLRRAEELQQLLSAENVHTTIGVLLEHRRFYAALSKRCAEFFEEVTGYFPSKTKMADGKTKMFNPLVLRKGMDPNVINAINALMDITNVTAAYFIDQDLPYGEVFGNDDIDQSLVAATLGYALDHSNTSGRVALVTYDLSVVERLLSAIECLDHTTKRLISWRTQGFYFTQQESDNPRAEKWEVNLQRRAREAAHQQT
ncbi:MAG TPA: hypothetical protein VJI15_02320 [Candidatus Nanoarchaeia archaeon]|nr:hypothetical protein [Candidatus Nanoarchaeia archaeon]